MAFLTSAPPSVTSYKTPAKVASTASLALSGVIGSIQIDSIALSSLSTGDRILLKNQSTGSENGIYELTVSGLNYSLARSSDADTSAKLSPNSLVPVSQGTVNADNVFQLTNNSVNLGTDSLVFIAVDSVALAGLAAEVTNRTNANLLDLKIASNLSDLASVGTAKTNLSLQNVDNTSDANKPVSTAQQTALNLKADLASPTFSGTVAGITAAMVGAPAGSGNSSGTNTGDNSANSLYTANPMTTAGDLIVGGVSGAQGRLAIGSTEKVLATDGTSSYWAIEGVKTGYLAGNVVLGRISPTLTASPGNNIILGVNATVASTAQNSVTIGSSATSITGASGGVNINNNIRTDGVWAFKISAQQTTDAIAPYSIVLGAGSGGTNRSISIGFNGCNNVGNRSVNIGDGASQYGSGQNTIHIGCSPTGLMADYSVTVGAPSYPTANNAVGIGHGVSANGVDCIAIGRDASTGTGTSQIIIGKGSGNTACSGANNTVVGADSFNGASLSTAYDNVIVGKGSGKLISTGRANLILGVGSAPALTTGSCNTYIGNLTNGFLATQTHSICVGYAAVAGEHSVSIGSTVDGAGGTVVGSYSVGIGAKVGGLSTDSESVRIGRLSSTPGGGFSGNIAGGSRSVCIGAYTSGALQATSYQNNDDCVYLGYAAGSWSMNKTNEFFLDNQSRSSYANQQTKSLLYGTFNATASSQTLAINAAVSTPYTLAVTGVATFTAAPVVSSVTASQILASGASKEVVSLSTATYPSLAELAYVKGVTSAVQTQLNSEATARSAADLLAVPAQSGNTEKVLATNGSSTYWAIEGIKTGYPTGSTILGRLKPASISGTYNTLIGNSAGSAMTTAGETVAIGHLALAQNTTGVENNAIGAHALEANTTGSSNTAIGLYTLQSNISGIQNTGIGCYALNHSTGNANVGIGMAALYINTTGSDNVAVGTNAMRLSTTGYCNAAVGSQALYSNTTGNFNVAIGIDSLQSNTTAADNVAIGWQALASNTTGNQQTFVGSGSGYSLTTGANNSGLGWFALRSATTGNENVALGHYSLSGLTTGNNSVAVGGSALSSTTTGGNNVAVGWHALNTNVTGGANVALGYAAGRNNAGSFNTFIGDSVNCSWTNATSTGDYNTITGAESFYVNTSGAANSAFGAYNLCTNTTGQDNSVLGCVSLYANTTGSYNVAIGREVLYVNTTGSESIAIGHFALQSNITGSNNVAIGSNAGRYATAGNEFYLNNQNRVNLAGDKSDSLMYGQFNATASSQTLAINAAVSVPNNISISTAGYGLKIKEGSNAKMGTSVLVAGTVTVSNTSVTATSRIMLTAQDNGGTIGFLSISARTAATSFTILSSSALDTSTVAWMIVEPA